MISSKSLIVEFDRRFDRFASEYKKNLRIEDKVSVLNEAQDKVFENLVSICETNSEVRNDLRPFEIKDKNLKIKKTSKDYTIVEIPEELYKILRMKVKAKKPNCGSKEIPVTIFQTDDLEWALKDEYWQPSYTWENVLGDEGSEGFYLYHNNDFQVERCTIDYYRKPKKLEAASMSPDQKGYEDANGEFINYDQDCEFDRTFKWHTIVDLAVLIARNDIGDNRDFSLNLNKILNKEKIT